MRALEPAGKALEPAERALLPAERVLAGEPWSQLGRPLKPTGRLGATCGGTIGHRPYRAAVQKAEVVKGALRKIREGGIDRRMVGMEGTALIMMPP